MLDAEAESLPVGRDLLGYEQVDRRLAHRIGDAGDREQKQQNDQRVGQHGGGQQARRCDEHAAAHRTGGADMVGKPTAPARS